MPIFIIGKTVLGKSGFCQVPSKIGEKFDALLSSIEAMVPHKLLMTSMTGWEECTKTNGCYYPKIRKVYPGISEMFDPRAIYHYCEKGEDKFRPGADFIIWDKSLQIAVATFSREAPILAFESERGKALGVILRPSLMKYGDYVFSTMKEALGDGITVTLVTCNHFEYPEGSIPSVIQSLADKYDMKCIIGEDSEKNPECYHRGETGNHVVVLW